MKSSEHRREIYTSSEIEENGYSEHDQKLYEDIMRSNHTTKPRACKKTSLSPNETNIVRYAAGYVPMVLMRRYEKSSSKNRLLSMLDCREW